MTPAHAALIADLGPWLVAVLVLSAIPSTRARTWPQAMVTVVVVTLLLVAADALARLPAELPDVAALLVDVGAALLALLVALAWPRPFDREQS